MRIKSLKLRNFRLFGADEQVINFSEDKNITIIVGNNGAGKSTILDAIALQLNGWISQFHGIKMQQYKETDIHIDNNGRLADYLKVTSDFSTNYNGIISITKMRKGRSNKKCESNYGQAKQYAEQIISRIENNQDCIVPLVAYYGTGRGQIQAPERKRSFQQVFSRWDCYEGALNASTNFKRFFAWYDQMEDEERREREKRRDFDYQTPMLLAVRRALSSFIGGKFQNPRIETNPLRFVVDEIVDGHKRELRIEQLSDGYKIITAMVADIASRMVEANPDMDNPLMTSGIVLIDEIDLHLHPKWQREIIRDLTHTFPNIQFIVSTHSPTLLLGAINEAQLLLMGKNEVEDVTGQTFDTYDIGQILLSNLFGLNSSRAPKWDDKMSEYDRLLSKPLLTEEETLRKSMLKKELSVIMYGSALGNPKLIDLLQKISE